MNCLSIADAKIIDAEHMFLVMTSPLSQSPFPKRVHLLMLRIALGMVGGERISTVGCQTPGHATGAAVVTLRPGCGAYAQSGTKGLVAGLGPGLSRRSGRAELRYTSIRRVRETAPGEDDDEYGSHRDYAAGNQGASPGRSGDEYTKFALGRYIKVEWNIPTSSTLRLVLLYSHPMTTRPNS